MRGRDCHQNENTDSQCITTFEGEIEVIGINTCGGCPGKKAVTIALATCITKGNPSGFACPHAQTMKEAISKKVGDTVKIIDYTH
jgi:predicted metal-binding protein